MEHVKYRQMQDGTADDYRIIMENARRETQQLPQRLIALLGRLRHSQTGDLIDRLEHSLQTASRAYRDAASEEMVVAALLHDVGDELAPESHSELAAAILRPFVSEQTYWIVKHHGVFQGYYYFHHIGLDRHEREQFRGHPWFEAAEQFCHRWDQTSFDPDYDTLPLSFFEPMIYRVFSREPWSLQQQTGE